MSPWTALILCAAANVCANLAFKNAVGGLSLDLGWTSLFKVLTQPWMWAGLAFASFVLMSYLYAIRQLPIGIAYPVVTSLAIIGTLAMGNLLLDEAIGARALIGVFIMTLGLILVSTS